jgi:hypothetical protein
MIKYITSSSFPSSKLTIWEYDLQQGAEGNMPLLFSVAYQWQLRHFKNLEQNQVLITSTATLINGLWTLFYSPLSFQVDVLGKNLERPFKSPAVVMRQEEMNPAKQQKQQNINKQTNNTRPVVPERRRRRCPPT